MRKWATSQNLKKQRLIIHLTMSGGDVTGNDASGNYVTGYEDADNKGATTHKNATAQNNFEFLRKKELHVMITEYNFYCFFLFKDFTVWDV